METGCKPTTPNDYEHLRDRMDAAKILWCTAGGQAVNLWALHYINAHPLIAGLSPFTSKDIDPLIISLRNTEKCPELKVTSWINNSAVSGVVSNHTGHLGELLKFLPGVPDGQWIDRIRRLNGWPIVPPDALYATKCWNLLNVPQKGRNDLRHLILLNYILETHLTQVTEEEREAILRTFQQLANNGTLTRVMEITKPQITSSITPHVTIPETPFPSFHVSSGLYEEIRKLPFDAPNVHELSSREEEWATVVVQFHDETKAQQIFMDAYGEALQNHLAILQKGIAPCRT